VLDAAKEKSVQGIGVDADQAYLGDQVMTSAQKKVDVAVETAIKAAQDGSLKGGTNTVFDLKNDGVGIGKTNAEGAKYEAQVTAVADKIKSGAITDIPDTVGK
jgi:basic membrane protein A